MNDSPYYHSHFLNYYSQNNDITKILDPISSIIRLALLSYKNDGSKISVDDNKIIFNEPGFWYQGLYRNFNGYSRQDLILLYPPILRVMYWFQDMNAEHIRNILYVTNKGLIMLRNVYKEDDGRIEMFLNHCITKIDNYINGEFEIDKLDNLIVLDEKRYEQLFKTIKQLWSEKEIEIISNKLMDIEEHLEKHETIECIAIHKYLRTIVQILEDKDKEFKNMIVFSKVGEIVNT